MKRPHFALPEIYDDSLSYYDVLRKLIKSMHAIVDNLNKIPEQIANEEKAREQADVTLQTNIDNEVIARQETDNELRELISTSGGGVTEAQLNEEVTARQQADTVLDGKISELKSDLANVQSAVSEKMDSYIIKTVMDSVATPNTQYYLGKQTAVNIVLPDSADVGQIITVCWYNGETAATVSITGTMLDFDYTPGANSRSEINALWDGLNWAVLGNEMAVVADA